MELNGPTIGPAGRVSECNVLISNLYKMPKLLINTNMGPKGIIAAISGLDKENGIIPSCYHCQNNFIQKWFLKHFVISVEQSYM